MPITFQLIQDFILYTIAILASGLVIGAWLGSKATAHTHIHHHH